MRFRSIVLVVLLVTLAAFGFYPGAVTADTRSFTYEGVAYNKVDFSELGYLEDIKISKEEDTLSISFYLNGQHYEINAGYFGQDQAGVKYASVDESSGVIFNVLETRNAITGVMSKKRISPINYTESDSIGFVISKTISHDVLGQVVQQARKENAEIVNRSRQSIYSIPSNQMLNHEVHLLNFRNLHVLASGASVPFLLTTGVAEGWAYSRHLTQQYFRVSDLQYSVAYNWPSDGVSLWYDYMNSDEAYHTPAWPSPGLTDVSGSWDIDATKGKFVAEATVTALVKGIPLGWTIYDVSDIY